MVDPPLPRGIPNFSAAYSAAIPSAMFVIAEVKPPITEVSAPPTPL